MSQLNQLYIVDELVMEVKSSGRSRNFVISEDWMPVEVA